MTSGNSGGYSGRRAPNFSQYLNELNMIPSPYDQALQQQQERNDVFDNIDSNLAMFANAEFLDFDTGLALSAAAADAAVLGEQAGQQSVQGGENDMERRGEGLDGEGDGLKYFDMLNGGEFLTFSLIFLLSLFLSVEKLYALPTYNVLHTHAPTISAADSGRVRIFNSRIGGAFTRNSV